MASAFQISATLKKISSGTYQLHLRDPWYQVNAKNVIVEDEKQAEVSFDMQKAFAELKVSTKPAANIFIEGEKKGNGTWQGRLHSGFYNVRVEKDKYYSKEKQVQIIAGNDAEETFELDAKTGTLNIITLPVEARINLNGKDYGTSPKTIDNLLIGKYELQLSKKAHATITKEITIQENETIKINEKLASGKNVSFKSMPTGADIYANDKKIGTSSLKTDLPFGRHKIKMVKGEKIKEQTIDVQENGPDNYEWMFSIMKMMKKSVMNTLQYRNTTIRV